jgi:hypothetical protein
LYLLEASILLRASIVLLRFRDLRHLFTYRFGGTLEPVTTYKNSTVDKLVKLGRCVACGRKLTEEDKGIRCGVCREDEKTRVAWP